MKSLMRRRLTNVLSVLVASLLFMDALHAQNVEPALADVQINWVSPSEAIDRLSQAISTLEQEVQNAGYASPLTYKLKYYSAVFNSIEQGMEVPVAVDANYGRFVPGVLDIPVEYPNSVPPDTWAAYRRDLTQLLQK